MSYKPTAFHKWIYHLFRDDVDSTSAYLFLMVTDQRNPQAMELLSQTGDSIYTKDTFDKAAKLLITMVEENGGQ